ncbi:MAG: SAM-dependent methyltransferase, partial [Spirochaetia bacterium]|nr:SAM-dependent methyltransferase [Spirochaetia bacterium]
VVLEALSLNISIIGYEINWMIARQAKANIAYFGYANCIVKGNLHEINEIYDVAIIDLPYGLFTSITHQQQKDIINSSRKITHKLVIITSVDMDEDITLAGFTITQRCTVNKGMFVRYVRVCY